MSSLIDMHCHLDLYPNPEQVAAQAIKSRAYILSVTTTPKAWRITKKLTASGDRVRTGLGLHPQLAHERLHELPLFEALLAEAKYVGEIGLDGSKDYKQYIPSQLKAFSSILNFCEKAGGRIMSIHSRGAASLVLDELERFPNAGLPILHWFSGNMTELNRAIDMGCWFSVGPSMMKSKSGQKLFEGMPFEKVLTETDGPFVESKGKPLRPADVGDALRMMDKIKGFSNGEAQEQIATNLRELVASV